MTRPKAKPSISIQALQADGTWYVRNAFINENAEVISEMGRVTGGSDPAPTQTEIEDGHAD